VIFAGIALKLGPIFPSFYPCPSFPSVTADNGKQFMPTYSLKKQNWIIYSWNSNDAKTRFSFFEK